MGYLIGRSLLGRRGCCASLAILALALMSAAMPTNVIAQEGAASDEAGVLMVHGAADAGEVDLYVDGSLEVSGMSYPSVSDTLALPDGDHEFAVVPTGAAVEEAIASTTLPLAAGETYHVALLGLVADLQVNVYPVDLGPIAPGQSRIRLINGSPDAGPLDLLLSGGDPLFPSVAFPSETDHAEIGAGTIDIELLATDSETVVLANAETELVAGTVYNLYAVGQLADDSLRLIQVASSGEASASGASEAAIVGGTCAGSGEADVVAQLNGPLSASGDSLGTADLPPVASSFTAVGLAFDEIIAAEHAVRVTRDAAESSATEICGEIGGVLTETGSLVIVLREANQRDLAGMAILAPSALEPDATDVTLLLTAEPPSNGIAAAADTAEATPEPTATEPAADEAEAGTLEGDDSVPEIVVIDNRDRDSDTEAP